MRIRSLICALACATLTCAPAAAHAAGHMPVEGGSVILAFGASYAGRTHRGIDITGVDGASVEAPAAGSVVFAGSVPADGGGTCGAVTIELPDGRRMTVLPLDEVWVRVGSRIATGDGLGSLAGAGDDSSSRSHVHLSLRSGNTYLDPAELLPGSVDPLPDESASAPAVEGVGAGGSSSAPVVAFAAGGVGAAAGSSSVADSGGGVGAIAGAASAAGRSAPLGAEDVGTLIAGASVARGLAHIAPGTPLASTAPRTRAIPVSAGVPAPSRLDFWSEPVVGGNGRTASMPAPRALALGAILSATLALCAPLIAGSAHRVRAAVRMR